MKSLAALGPPPRSRRHALGQAEALLGGPVEPIARVPAHRRPVLPPHVLLVQPPEDLGEAQPLLLVQAPERVGSLRLMRSVGFARAADTISLWGRRERSNAASLPTATGTSTAGSRRGWEPREALAREYGFSTARVSQIVAAVDLWEQKRYREQRVEDVRRCESATLEHFKREALAAREASKLPTVTSNSVAGTDGEGEDVGRQETTTKSTSGDPRHLEVAIAASHRLCQLWDAWPSTKVEHTGTIGLVTVDVESLSLVDQELIREANRRLDTIEVSADDVRDVTPRAGRRRLAAPAP